MKITYITNPEYFGYYDEPTQEVPAYDPGKKAPCLICGKPWDDETVRTICFTVVKNRNGTKRDMSFFYRVHRDCHNNLSDEERDDFENSIVDSTEAN